MNIKKLNEEIEKALNEESNLVDITFKLQGSDVLAVFLDTPYHVNGDELRYTVYSFKNHDEYLLDAFKIDELPDVSLDVILDKYKPLLQELKEKGYVSNISENNISKKLILSKKLNEHVDPDDLESATDEIKRKLDSAAESIKSRLETIEGIRIGGLDFNTLQHIVDRVEEVLDNPVDEIYDM